MGDLLGGLDGVVNEDDKSWTLSLDVPCVAKEHLDVSVSGSRVAQ